MKRSNIVKLEALIMCLGFLAILPSMSNATLIEYNFTVSTGVTGSITFDPEEVVAGNPPSVPPMHINGYDFEGDYYSIITHRSFFPGYPCGGVFRDCSGMTISARSSDSLDFMTFYMSYMSDEQFFLVPLTVDRLSNLVLGKESQPFFDWYGQPIYAYGTAYIESNLVYGTYVTDLSKVPEPATLLLLGTGLIGFAVPRIRKKLKL